MARSLYPESWFPTHADLPQLSAKEANALLKELHRFQVNGLVSLQRGRMPQAPLNRHSVVLPRCPWFVDLHWPAGTQRITLQAWAEAWLVEEARRVRRAMFMRHRP